MHRPKVIIIGAGGSVGATAASTLAVKEVAHEIVLIDIAEKLAQAHAIDINHATAYTHGVQVRMGDYSDIAENDIVVVTCGIAQQPGQSRLELLRTNVRIVHEVMRKVKYQGEQVFVLMVANPVDILTYAALKASGLPKERVFGTGTTLDTARLRVMLAQRLGVSHRHIHAYVFGEHGDSSFPAFSSANVAGIPLRDFPGFDHHAEQTIMQDIRDAAYKIVAANTASKYGIGNVIAQLVGALMCGTKSIHPVASLVEGEYGLDDVVLGLPNFVSSRGVAIIPGYRFSSLEHEQLMASADVITQAIRSVDYL